MFMGEKANLSFSKQESFFADLDWNALLGVCYSSAIGCKFFANINCRASSFEYANSGLSLNGVYSVFWEFFGCYFDWLDILSMWEFFPVKGLVPSLCQGAFCFPSDVLRFALDII